MRYYEDLKGKGITIKTIIDLEGCSLPYEINTVKEYPDGHGEIYVCDTSDQYRWHVLYYNKNGEIEGASYSDCGEWRVAGEPESVYVDKEVWKERFEKTVLIG